MATKGQTKSRLQRELRNAYRLLRKTGQEITEKVRSTDKYNDLRRRLKNIRPQLQSEAVKEIQRQERLARREGTGKRKYSRLFEEQRQRLQDAGVPVENLPHALPSSLEKYRASDIKKMTEALTYESAMTKINVTAKETTTQAIKDIAEIQLQSVRAYADAEKKKRLQTETTLHGEATGMKRGEMGDLRLMSNAPTSEFRSDRGYANWAKHLESIEKYMERNDADLYKENYIKGLYKEYGSKADKLVNFIEQIPAKLMLDWYYQEQDVDINFYYELDGDNKRLTHLEEVFAGLYRDSRNGGDVKYYVDDKRSKMNEEGLKRMPLLDEYGNIREFVPKEGSEFEARKQQRINSMNERMGRG